MEQFAGDNDNVNHEFLSIIVVVAMALSASTCVWRAIFRAVQPVWGRRIHVL